MNCVICKEKKGKVFSLKELIQLKPLVQNQCCQQCYSQFNKINLADKTRCSSCCKELIEGETCDDCLYWKKAKPMIKMRHQSIFDYNEGMQQFFNEYKFTGNQQLANAFCSDVRQAILAYSDFYIIPIPLSKKRQKERGFNQVERILAVSNIAYHQVLTKNTHTTKQSSKNRVDRLESKQVFKVKEKYLSRIQGQKLLLVDDIFTTGSTMMHAYECLISEKPKEIRSFSLAR